MDVQVMAVQNGSMVLVGEIVKRAGWVDMSGLVEVRGVRFDHCRYDI